MNLRSFQINPLRIASAALFIAAPFFSWITVSAFGITAEATLLDVANSNTPLNVPSNLPLISVIATILLLIGGLVILRKATIGLPVATTGLALFLYSSYNLYGSPVSIVPVVVAPGIGLLAALVSIAIGAASFRVPNLEASSLIIKARTREGITGIGLFIASLALTLDGLNHTGQGELSAFIGTGMIEPVFHLGFIISILLLAVLFSMRKKWVSKPANSILIATAFAFILLDAAYHLSTGEISGFVGHDSTEILLHASAYYGAAFLLIGRLMKR
jgi:hypothetical protein